MKKIGFILVIFVLLVGFAYTGQSPGVGDEAPDFSLLDVSGNEVRLSDFKGKKNVVLIFYSSHKDGSNPEWPTCTMQLGEVQKQISEIKKFDAEVIAIATKGDQQDVNKSKRLLGLTFTLIPKPNKKVAEDFGVWPKYMDRAVATIIIDKKGRIRFKEVSKSTHRTSAPKIISELQGI